ncbi:putative ssDNA binding protein [Bacillus phage vB_BspM_MarvelLand]|nr:putative ssDNA binding protein [Bacillus phage vB_BspM_MarvelLand]
MTFKLVVAGSRDFNNYEYARYILDHVLQHHLPDVEIVSGKARGGDKMGELYADERGLPVKDFPANWNQFGKSAGYRRNTEMADYIGFEGGCVCFWDGKSRGTKHMIDICLDKGIPLRVIHY